MSSMDILRVVLAGLFFGLGLLGVFKAPLGFLWKPAVAATEAGHVLSVFPLALLIWALLQPTKGPAHWATIGLAAAAWILLLSSLLRALGYAKEAEVRLERAFPKASAPAFPGAPARPAPIVFGDLLHVPCPTFKPTRHLYREIDGHKLYLDLYQHKEAEKPEPLVVVIHGGSWNSGDSTQLAWLNSYLAARSFSIAAINYRLAPRHTFPAQRDDALAALAWLKDNGKRLGLDTSHVALLGRSAGAELALLAGYTAEDPAIRAVIALYAPSDLNWSWENPTNPLVLDSPKTLREYLGGTPAEVKAHFDAASAIDFIKPNSPATLLIHGSRDELVFADKSRRVEGRLAKANVPHALLELPWATHGCDANPAGPGGQITTWAVERFLAAAFDLKNVNAPKTSP